MWRLYTIFLLLVGLFAPASARAQDSCATVDALWDSVSVIRKMQRTDSPDLRVRLSRTLASLSASTDPAVARYRDAVTRNLEGGASARALLETVTAQNLSTGMQGISVQHNCDEFASSGQSDTSGDAAAESGNFEALSPPGHDPVRQTGASSMSNVGEQGPEFISGVLFKGDLYLFFAMLSGLLALPVLLYLRRTSKAYLEREERRMLLEPVRVRVDNREHVMTLVDISMNGFKLRHEGGIEGTPKLFVELDGIWTAGLVRWSNAQFAGVKFHRAIDARTLAAVLEGDEERMAA